MISRIFKSFKDEKFFFRNFRTSGRPATDSRTDVYVVHISIKAESTVTNEKLLYYVYTLQMLALN